MVCTASRIATLPQMSYTKIGIIRCHHFQCTTDGSKSNMILINFYSKLSIQALWIVKGTLFWTFLTIFSVFLFGHILQQIFFWCIHEQKCLDFVSSHSRTHRVYTSKADFDAMLLLCVKFLVLRSHKSLKILFSSYFN